MATRRIEKPSSIVEPGKYTVLISTDPTGKSYVSLVTIPKPDETAFTVNFNKGGSLRSIIAPDGIARYGEDGKVKELVLQSLNMNFRVEFREGTGPRGEPEEYYAFRAMGKDFYAKVTKLASKNVAGAQLVDCRWVDGKRIEKDFTTMLGSRYDQYRAEASRAMAYVEQLGNGRLPASWAEALEEANKVRNEKQATLK